MTKTKNTPQNFSCDAFMLSSFKLRGLITVYDFSSGKFQKRILNRIEEDSEDGED